MGNLAFNAQSVAPSFGGGGQLPVSDEKGHHVRITNTEVKPVKNGDQNSGYLELTLTVVSGEFAGASGALRLNIYHTKQNVVEIAYGQLSAICHAIGRYQINNHEDLRGGELRAVVQPQAADAKYTEVRGVKYLDGSDVKPGTTPPAAQQQNAPQNGGGGFQGNQQQGNGGNANNFNSGGNNGGFQGQQQGGGFQGQQEQPQFQGGNQQQNGGGNFQGGNFNNGGNANNGGGFVQQPPEGQPGWSR